MAPRKAMLSDGGDGFLEAVEAIVPHVRPNSVRVRAPHGRLIDARWLWEPASRTAYIESAEVLGLRLVPPSERRPLQFGSGALGVLIAHVLAHGARQLIVGLGGTATCDAGLGMLGVLAAYRLARQTLGPCPQWSALDLAQRPSLDLPALRRALEDIRITALTDVDSPLLGPNGAARRFAPQKGASASEIDQLEQLIASWAQQVEQDLGAVLASRPGAGAAGGLGFAFLALGARLAPGAEFFLDHPEFRQALLGADLVLCAEGRFDATSLAGKAPWKLALAARNLNKQVAIFCATADVTARAAASGHGIDVVAFAEGLPMEQACRCAYELLRQATFDYLTTR